MSAGPWSPSPGSCNQPHGRCKQNRGAADQDSPCWLRPETALNLSISGSIPFTKSVIPFSAFCGTAVMYPASPNIDFFHSSRVTWADRDAVPTEVPAGSTTMALPPSHKTRTWVCSQRMGSFVGLKILTRLYATPAENALVGSLPIERIGEIDWGLRRNGVF